MKTPTLLIPCLQNHILSLVMAASMAGLSACGYQLRTSSLPAQLQHKQAIIQGDSQPLTQALITALQQAGMQVMAGSQPIQTPDADNIINLRLSNTQLIRQAQLYTAQGLPTQWRLQLSSLLTLAPQGVSVALTAQRTLYDKPGASAASTQADTATLQALRQDLVHQAVDQLIQALKNQCHTSNTMHISPCK